MQIDIISAPMSYGCDKPGCELAPDKIKESGINEILNKLGYKTNNLEKIEYSHISEENKFKDSKNMKYLSSIIELNEKLAKQTQQALNQNNIALILGGDHSIAMGSIAGASSTVELDKFGVIWIDAHGDLNTEETSSSKNVHGMPLAASMDIGNKSLTNIHEDRKKVKPNNVYHIGARDLDQGEIDLIKSIDINMYTTKTIRQIGIDNILDDVIQKIKQKRLDKIHLSFDIDFISGEYVVGTGTRVNNGFNIEETKHILSRICSELPNIKSIDIVELNPKLDINEQTSKITIDIIETIFKNMNKQISDI